MNRRALFAGVGTLVVLVAVGLAVLLATAAARGPTRARASARRRPRRPSRPPGDLNTCAGLIQDEGRACYSRELAKIVNDAADPLAAVEGITAAAYADKTGFLLANCHGIMHTVAREYALRTHLTLAKLMDNLPRDQRPGLLGRLRPRPRHRGRAGDREGRPEGRRPALRRVRRPATSATRARTASGTRSCA